MKYERFSELWDALVTNRPQAVDAAPITNGMESQTASALIAYANGDKSQIQSIRSTLGHALR
jgi:hypothetical protein